jgi:IMP cyclohydrolase
MNYPMANNTPRICAIVEAQDDYIIAKTRDEVLNSAK